MPLILHFSCHGTYDKNSSSYSLCLEKSKDSCILDHYVENRVRTLIQDSKAKKLLIVFISACHSEKIGKVFKKYGAPVVIAINKDSKVKDLACLEFSQGFYHCLLSGGTP